MNSSVARALILQLKKVVLLAHGTGGTIVSVVLDRLLADLPASKECLGKLEIYTFGCAASWMSNPNKNLGSIRDDSSRDGLVVKGNASGRKTEENEKIISHIEHYANENDVLARWGILYNIREVPINRYTGRVFIVNGKSSPLLGTGYLDQLWPICHSEQCNGSGKSCTTACHIHTTQCETLRGCKNNGFDHARGCECGTEICRNVQGELCTRSNCEANGRIMTCTNTSCRSPLGCDNEKLCEMHGVTCRDCEIHGWRCDGKHDVVCSKGCEAKENCGHVKYCDIHGLRCTAVHAGTDKKIQAHTYHHHGLLDQVVEVDVEGAAMREFTAQVASMLPLRKVFSFESQSWSKSEWKRICECKWEWECELPQTSSLLHIPHSHIPLLFSLTKHTS